MANPTPMTSIVLTASQRHQMRKVLGKAKQRENARWFREGVMDAMSTVGLYDKAKAANGVHVASVQVEAEEVHDNVTYFQLRVCGSSGVQWHVFHRFSEFYSLRKQLGVRDKRVGTIFPQKTWFNSGNEAVPLLKNRQGLLQMWIDGLLREFATGGDGCNSLIAINWTNKLMILHNFFGVNSAGRLLPHARLAEAVPAIAAPVASALATPTLAPSAWAASAPPMQEAVVATVVATAVAEVPVSSTAADEDEEFRAALAASVTSYATAQGRQKIALELGRRAQLAAEESRRRAQLAAEDEAARLIAEKAEAKRIQNAELLATRRKMEKEMQARRKAEVEEVRRKAEQEDAQRKVEEEEARRKADELAKKPWLEQALDMAGVARQLEDQGQMQQALDHYKKCIAIFMMAWKKESSEKIKGAIQEKVADMSRHTKELTAAITAAEVTRVAEILSVPVPLGPLHATPVESREDTPVADPIVTVTTSAPAPTPVARIAVAS